MRVLIAHNGYQQAGGEDMAAANEHALLARHGCDTCLWSVSNNVIDGAWRKISTAVRTPYSWPARDEAARLIAEFKPQIVHVHNFFPLLSPSIYDACRPAGVALVQTLHNYRTICAGSLLARDGHPCEDCIRGSPYHAVLHGCYRGSRLGSLAVARMIDTHRRRETWSRKIDRFIALSNFAKTKFVEAGFPADRIAVKPNFTEDRCVVGPAARSGALYVGRLSWEKGIEVMLRAWESIELELRVVGGGELHGRVSSAGAKVLAFGRKMPAEVAVEMARAAFLILPSLVYENFPMVIVEAYCQGLPVIASRIGGLPDIVEDGVTGLLFAPGEAEDLVAKVHWAHSHPAAMHAMGARARRRYEENYSPSLNIAQLLKIYEAAVGQARSSPDAPTTGARR